ncbi:hypothetical protein [Candidatus Puniceispirillum sp.]|uniref:hypothetical protein n=1 Tax=Candidatus Puniceispirillum sp. TaxID=2026719 RepID=UPI003F69FF09
MTIHFWRFGVLIGTIAVISTAAFITSFKFTSIANVVMIYATVPLMAGIPLHIYRNPVFSAASRSSYPCFVRLVFHGGVYHPTGRIKAVITNFDRPPQLVGITIGTHLGMADSV